MKKKLTLLLLSALFSTCLVGCGLTACNGNPNSSDSPSESTSDTTSESSEDLEQIAAQSAVDALDIPTALEADYTLPASAGATEFAWSIVQGDGVELVGNTLKTKIVSEDTPVQVRVIATYGEASVQKEFTITVKKLEGATAMTLAEAASAATDSKVITQGTVVSKARNQGGSIYSIVLSDKSSYVRADFGTQEEIDVFAIGDVVKVVGTVSSLSGLNVSRSEKSGTETVDYARYAAPTVETEEQYAALAAAGYTGAKMYRLVNPYLICSGSTSYSYWRFGGSAEGAENGHENVLTQVLIDGAILTGVKEDMDGLGIPLKRDGAEQFMGTVYVLAVYSGNSGVQFGIPCKQALALTPDYEARAESEIQASVAVRQFDASQDGGSFTLVSETANAKNIVWTSDSENLTVGVGSAFFSRLSGDDVVATLTAQYSVNDVPKSTTVQIVLKAGEIPAMTVSEVLASEDTSVSKMEGFVAGFVPGHSGSATVALGVYITDGTNVLTITKVGGELLENGWSYKVGETELTVGMKLTLENVVVNRESAPVLECGEATTVAVDTEATLEEVDLAAETVIDSDDDLSTFVGSMTKLTSTSARDYKVIRFVATEENPIYLGFATQNGKTTAVKYFISLSYLKDKDKTSTQPAVWQYTLGDSASTPGVIGFHTTTLTTLMGQGWVLQNTMMTNASDYASYKIEKEAAGTYAFSGTFYAVLEYVGSSTYPFVYLGLLGTGFQLTRIVGA